MQIAYLDCFSGISGDMFLGALVDAGVPLELLQSAATALNVGAELKASKVSRGGIMGTLVEVITPENLDPEAKPKHRHLNPILKIIHEASLSDGVKRLACRGFQMLGEAEAAVHGIAIEKVHFHEVGAVDTIVDIVCAAVGMECVGVDRWLSSPLNVGSGTVQCQHGTMPVPAPATQRILAGAPIYSNGIPMERVTPTGATILALLGVGYAPLPTMRTTQTGYGAGGRDPKGESNLLRLSVGEVAEDFGATAEQVVVIEAAIDDASPQLLAYVSELLLAGGALDVYRTPIVMKKGRAGTLLTVLGETKSAEQLRGIILRETTSIGLRWRVESRQTLDREIVDVATKWGKVRVKAAHHADGSLANATPEFEDCRAIAEKHGVPLKQVTHEALAAFHQALPQGHAHDGEQHG